MAFNEKNWERIRATITPDFVYDEVATRRKAGGADAVIGLWQGWAQAFPDSKCSFDNALVSGSNVVLELTWRGIHRGQLQTPAGPIAATGKPIEIRACAVVELAGEKVRSQRHYFDMVGAGPALIFHRGDGTTLLTRTTDIGALVDVGGSIRLASRLDFTLNVQQYLFSSSFAEPYVPPFVGQPVKPAESQFRDEVVLLAGLSWRFE